MQSSEHHFIDTELAERIIKAKYYQPGEDWEKLSQRVARAVVAGGKLRAERAGKCFDIEGPYWEAQYFNLINEKVFLPGGRVLANAGTGVENLSNCFGAAIGDSREEIYGALKTVAEIHAKGGGTGLDFSALREEGARINSTGGESSGPVSFMRLFDLSGEVIKQGSRRAAMLAAMDITHPDIFKFITSKLEEGRLKNFNISVKIPDRVMEAYLQDEEVEITSPLGNVVKKVRAKELLHKLAEYAWRTGDPGVLFIDTLNKQNPFPEGGEIVVTNPCGEIPSVHGSSCILGSINLVKFLQKEGGRWTFDLPAFQYVVAIATTFLNDVMEVTTSGIELFDTVKEREKKIGLGVMGWADLLVALRIPYDSLEALELAELLGKVMYETALNVSKRLAHEYGEFYPGYGRYNSALLALAPTGTLSLISGVNYAAEPFFALAYKKNFKYGKERTTEQRVISPVAVTQLLYEEFEPGIAEQILWQIADTGTLEESPEFSAEINARIRTLKPLVATAYEISPEARIRMQAAWQKHVDQSISSTINLPNTATVEEIENILVQAWQAGLKGFTVFRDGCRTEQILEKV